MKRTPLKRKTPMKRNQKPLKRTPLKRVSQSKNAKAKRKSYASAKREYMEDRENPNHCERCEVELGIKFLDLHHKAGRGKNLSNKSTFTAICRPCHDWIHAHPKDARETGWLV